MKAGVGKACVNPPLGMAMEGLGQQGGCQTIHDDLFVRVVYLDHGRESVLVVAFDLLFFERPVVDDLKAALGKELGLRPDQILVNFSHTHAGPRLTRWCYSGKGDPAYLARVQAATVRAARAAKAAAVDVTLQAGMARTAVPVSRRKVGPDGKAQWAPFRQGVICEALPFCLMSDARERVVALLFSVSCHPSMIYSLDISADYPGAAMRNLNAHFQTEGSVFLQGAGGDTKPRQIAVEEDHWRRGTWEDMEAAGREVADAVIAESRQGLRRVEPDLKTVVIKTEWPLEPVPTREQLQAVAADGKEREERRAWAREMLDVLTRKGELPNKVQVDAHGVKIGPGVRLVGVEGELVGELGNLLLSLCGDGITFPMGYTDGCQIYLPSSRMLPEGSYEVDSFWEYHFPSPLAPGAETILENAVGQLRAAGVV